jgi:hypothetical protein
MNGRRMVVDTVGLGVLFLALVMSHCQNVAAYTDVLDRINERIDNFAAVTKHRRDIAQYSRPHVQTTTYYVTTTVFDDPTCTEIILQRTFATGICIAVAASTTEQSVMFAWDESESVFSKVYYADALCSTTITYQTEALLPLDTCTSYIEYTVTTSEPSAPNQGVDGWLLR